MKFRKKPVVIEAEQWTPGMIEEIEGVEPVKHDYLDHLCKHCSNYFRHHGWCGTLEGGHIVCPGDWIITGVQGEKYPCKPDIFEATYEKVEEELKCFHNDVDWVIAKNIDDVWIVWCDHIGENKEDYIEDFHWKELPMNEVLTMYDENKDNTTTKKTVKQWIASEGRGFLMSTEF